ncbi:MAG: hypothetical protein PHQ52_08020, partial [Candidatus Omnitrophica bacterium]|nr:hypothetical protein [Candidatus Omnitrophota bacterium]
KISYDLPEQNLVAIADKHMNSKDYPKAFYYYEKALKVNPKYKDALEGYNYLNGYMYRKAYDKKSKAVEWRATVENFIETGDTLIQGKDFTVKKDIGMDIEQSSDGNIRVLKVYKSTPAYEAGLKKDDILVAIWGSLCRYMDVSEIEKNFLKPEELEIKITVDKTLHLKKKSLTLDQLEYVFDGLSLKNIEKTDAAYKQGFRNGDIILSIDKDSIRYVSLSDVIKKLDKASYNIIIRRGMTIWRKKESII